MGALEFMTGASGPDADTAFAAARERALHEHGHGGYTGSIADKHAFVMVTDEPLAAAAAMELADELTQSDERIADKRGPAGCIAVSSDPTVAPRSFLFFGWAPW